MVPRAPLQGWDVPTLACGLPITPPPHTHTHVYQGRPSLAPELEWGALSCSLWRSPRFHCYLATPTCSWELENQAGVFPALLVGSSVSWAACEHAWVEDSPELWCFLGDSNEKRKHGGKGLIYSAVNAQVCGFDGKL